MNVNNLKFFDKEGYNLNFRWNKLRNVWEGNIYLPKVSVGLYANTEVYVMEETNGGLYFPVANNAGDKIVFKWDILNKFVDEFFMFTFDETQQISETSALIYTPQDGPEPTKLYITQYDTYEVPLNDELDNRVLPVHIGFITNPKYDATTYKRTLVMYFNNEQICRINLFAETVEEDERLKVWTNNLGYNITPQDTVIFKDSDIKECMPNYITLNEKRKELLLEGSNIYPYVGSYKALINAIKFFGYDNLAIVEYWKNINPEDDNFCMQFRASKYSLTERECIYVNGKEISLPNKNYKKTNRISLVYTINHPDVNSPVDEYELPQTIEDFKFTMEEVIIKLFALKKKLDKEFMPGSSRITDIVGEGNYFGLNSIANNVQYSSTVFVKEGTKISFDVFPNKYVHITDDAGFENYIINNALSTGRKTDCVRELNGEKIDSFPKISKQINVIKDISSATLADLMNEQVVQSDEISMLEDEYAEYYKTYYDRIKKSLEEESVDNDLTKIYGNNIPVSAKVVLNNTSFDDRTIGEVDIMFKNFDDNLTFDNFESFGYNEIEWSVTWSEDQTDDELKTIGVKKVYEYPGNDSSESDGSDNSNSFWSYTISGTVDDLKQILIELPYVGYYDVKLTLTDTYNNNSTKILQKVIKVEPYNLDVRGFYYDARKLPEEFAYDLNDYNQEDSDSDSDTYTNPLEEIIRKYVYGMTGWARQEHIEKESLDESMPNYDANGYLSHPGPYKFSNVKKEWELISNINYDISLLEPDMEDARYIHSGVDIKPYTWFLLGYEFSKVYGKKDPVWTLTNLGTGDSIKHEGKYLTCLLKETGDYKVELQLSDTNGNKYNIERNIFVVSDNANYKLYNSLKKEVDESMLENELVDAAREELIQSMNYEDCNDEGN